MDRALNIFLCGGEPEIFFFWMNFEGILKLNLVLIDVLEAGS